MLLPTPPWEAELKLEVTPLENTSSMLSPQAGFAHQMKGPARLGLCSTATSKCVNIDACWSSPNCEHF